MTRVFSRRVWPLALIVIAFGGPFCVAGPTDTEPSRPLEVREAELNTAWIGKITDKYGDLDKQMESLTSRQKLTVGDVQAVNAAYRLYVQIDRVAIRLSELREPAGVDMHLRVMNHHTKLKEMSQQIKSESDFQSFQAKLARDYISEARKREKVLTKVRSLAKQGKLDEADQTLNDEQDFLEAGKLWLDDAVWGGVMGRFGEARREIGDKVQRLHTDQNEASLKEALGDKKPNLKQESIALQRAAQSLKATPETNYLGKSCTGPQLITAALDHWSELQREVIRYEVNYWYLKKSRDASVEQEYEAFRTQIGNLIAEVVAADAERINEAEARPLYLAHVTAIAPIVARSFDDKLHDILRAGLDPLLEKSPQLRVEVDGYEQATEGILTWRERAATAYAKSRRKEFTNLVETYSAASQRVQPLRGLFSNVQKPGSLFDPADRLMQVVAPQMINKKVVLVQIDGSRASNQSTYSRLQGGCFASLQLNRMPPATVALLKSDLLVTDERPPLSLKAAGAIWAAENGCVDEIGADVTAVEFQALAPRCLQVTASDSHLVHTSEIATQQFLEPEKQVMTRFEVHPVWYRYRYQFVGP
ncbi:MAG: hypothetical protein NT069_14240 [Planctomycetota bacterium]|nr:hypothetical protein [Planctomycetota bacterium]